MNIVSNGCGKYYHCLRLLADNVREYYNKQLIIYDLGLSDEQKANLDAIVIKIPINVSFDKYSTAWKRPIFSCTHKPFCVRHYFEEYSSEPMVLIDADCFFVKKVRWPRGFDVGVTMRHKKRLDLTNPYTGIINAGVIFFNTYAKKLIDVWAAACEKENAVDQKELCEILSESVDWKRYNKVYDWRGIKVKVLKCDVYNDYRCKRGKIFHLKGNRHEESVLETVRQYLREGKNIRPLFIGENKII